MKNIRESGEGALLGGRTTTRFAVEEFPGEENVPVLRAYLDRWHWQVGTIMNVPKDAAEASLRTIAHKHPVFAVLKSDSRGFL